ncbi:hypothetical protein MESS2_190026 [Mesorhizobium metallidurans STM 2683]|uniref:Thioesterase domain-containing protein n=1 Tax=Mesorhizobium metallidurans STM 2683 TaxID=1297569 RepID=M5ENP6_9HYPH|nr:hypothetical protein [Mesorhizobium metallidurans]CCV05957.1 hypothetical protein MESS2_190026 [Mesorhizobium metallidurans STM 2683]
MFRGIPNERHLNPLGSVHGGWAATLLDSALTLLEQVGRRCARKSGTSLGLASSSTPLQVIDISLFSYAANAFMRI